jgi:hypothetical protein
VDYAFAAVQRARIRKLEVRVAWTRARVPDLLIRARCGGPRSA